MSIEKVREYFKSLGLADRIQEFNDSSATVELAAEALGCEPGRIAKTLAFRIGNGCMLLVVAGDAKVDNPKYKARFGLKAKMIAPDETETFVGHAVGGICPFAIPSGIPVFLDESLKRFDIVFPAAGSSNSGIGLTLAELERCSGAADWVDVCKCCLP